MSTGPASAPSTPRTGADAAAVSHGVALANGRADGPFGYGPVARHRCDCLRPVPNAMWVLALPTLAVAGVAAVAMRHAVPHDLWLILAGNALLSFGAYVLTLRLIPVFIPYLLKGGLDGVDIGKPGRREDKTPIPESLGVVPGVVYIIAVTFSQLLYGGGSTAVLHSMLVEYNAALHSIGFMIFLGFADDVVDLPWRYKLILPTVATLPLLVAYSGSTLIIVPKPLRFILGGSIELGILYQVYMGLLAVFCTNAINIYAGINGLEVTQSIIIGCAVCVHNVMELCGVAGAAGMLSAAALPHVFSLCLTLPFVCASLGLLHHNTYPSRVFVGDTYTYFAGMTFAVVGILGHFSKTLLLFFIPQILNFLISVPQLFGYISCPRHRLPLINQQTGLLEGQTTNWNLLNVFLLLTGPMHERTLNIALALLQIACCALGLFVRYVVSGWVF